MEEKLQFTGIEVEKNKELLSILDDWKKQVATKSPIIFQDDGMEYPTEQYFSYDGFFSGYFSQKHKVLFIGREPRWLNFNLYDTDYRTANIKFFETDNVNSNTFWSNVLYMLYGIQNEGKIKFEELPCADEIAKNMVATGNFGFAVMNISKYANNSDAGATRNIELMNRFLQDSELHKRNFFLEELKLLDPDVIITANIWDCGLNGEYLGQCFPGTWSDELSQPPIIANHWKYKLETKDVDVINTYHFAAYTKNSKESFYDPVMKILFPNA